MDYRRDDLPLRTAPSGAVGKTWHQFRPRSGYSNDEDACIGHRSDVSGHDCHEVEYGNSIDLLRLDGAPS